MKHAFNKGVLSSKMAVSLVSGGLLFAAGQAWALTEAGTDIKNQATVTYEDANGNSYSAQSNEAVVTVAEVYAGTLRSDGSKAGAPGETVYFSHSLKNTGNARDTFVLSGRDGGATGALLMTSIWTIPTATASLTQVKTLSPRSSWIRISKSS